ncbi:MAG: M48 family metallopeptidase [Gammaproteobacteria bacterium]
MRSNTFGRNHYRQNLGQKRGGIALRLWPILIFALYLAYYWFSNQEKVPMTDRSQLINLTYEEEAALGYQSYQQVLSQENVIPSGELVDQMREIGDRLATAAADVDPGFEWEFNLIDSPQANAFALPGGKVAVYTGILEVTANVNGLSAVMGHEIAHAIARHGAERMAYQKLIQWGAMAVSIAVGDMGYNTQRMVQGALGMGSKYGVLLPFSRSHESEADYMGLIFTARACYDPREAPKLWERMGEKSKGQPQEFTSTHPSHETRIKKLNEWMPEALEIYEKNCSGDF